MASRIAQLPRASRRAILGVFAGLLPRPGAARARSDGICRGLGTSPLPSENHPDFLWTPIRVSHASAAATLHLRIAIAPDGSAEMDGAILVVSALDATAPVSARRRPRRLTANGAPAQATCGDADGDGSVELARLAADFADAQTGAPVAVSLEAQRDIERPGVYVFRLRLGDAEIRVEGRVAFGPAPRRWRGRKR